MKIEYSFKSIKKVYQFALIAIFVLATVGFSFSEDLIPVISIEPNTQVEVGEEVYLSATGTTYPDKKIFAKARYEWDFGDGYYLRFDPYVRTITRQGIAATHYYMKPGKFIVTLKVTIWKEFDLVGKPVGSPIAVNTTTRDITVIGEKPIDGFEIQRAPFHNRLAQYLYVQIPEFCRENQTTLKVKLEGAKGSKNLLLSKKKLAAEERVFLDHMQLDQDDYVVVAELLNAKGNRLPGGLWLDKFSKRYLGIPKVGIDQNNSIRINGKLFFPIASFMLDTSKFDKYINYAGINALNTEGYYKVHDPKTWNDYLKKAEASKLMAIGPGRGDYSIKYAPYIANRWKFNNNTDRIAEYVKANKNQPALLAWIWQDEPNMGGRTEKTYLPTLAAWAYICHREDTQHPNYNLFLGTDWSKHYSTGPNIYDYLGSAPLFGGKKWTQDIFSFDLYPITQRLHPSLNFTDMGPYAAYLDLLDRVHKNNKNLVPVFPALQPCAGKTDSIVSEEQVYLEAWLNVIHGAKGYNLV